MNPGLTDPAITRLTAMAIRPPGPWAGEALCRDVADPDIFYPTDGDRETAEQAREICGRCPVREPCLTYALAGDERYGIWGGLDPNQRAALSRRLRKDAQRKANRRSAA